MSDLGLPYSPHTPQVEGRRAEKALARQYGARLHPNSGAGRIKDDASNEDAIFEFKTVAKTHGLSGAALEALFRRAALAGKEARYIVKFGNGIVADITLKREIR